MKVLLRDTSPDSEFLQALDRIDPKSFSYTVVPDGVPGRELCLGWHFWLGASRNNQTWVLLACTLDEDFGPQHAVAALLDPPKAHGEAIAEILLRVYVAGRSGDRLDAAALEGIIASVPFPEYRPVGDYLPEAPQDWHNLPAEWMVGFVLSDKACVSQHTFDEYQRDSVGDVLRVVCGPRHDGLLINYTLTAREVVPLLAWDCDWPLSRRGKAPPERREKVQGMLPWEYEADRSLLTIYQHVPGTGFWCAPPYCSKPVVRLRVGGRTREQAIANWHACADVLRRVRKALPEDNQGET